jgi:hypothetical protein
MNIETREALEVAISWLVPGFVLSAVLRKFIPFLRWETNQAILTYLASGSLFAALRLLGLPFWLTGLVLPILVGFVLGITANRYREKLSSFLPLPATAWDAAFWMQREPCFVVVVLKNGTVIRGIYGINSRASSDPDRRDLLLQGILSQDLEGRWHVDRQTTGLWIDGSQIVAIKFVGARTGDENVQRAASQNE